MGLKKQLGMGVVTAALGLSLVGGGTYAYFSDSETTENTFAAGTLDLSAEPTTVIDVDNLKPGDTMTRDFELTNEGTLDIKSVSMDTDYDVIDAENDNTDDFGKYIEVTFLYNADQFNEVVFETTLDELQGMNPEAVEEEVFGEMGGLETDETHDLVVDFEFNDNGEDQNEFQGDKLELEWTFIAEQEAGEDN